MEAAKRDIESEFRNIISEESGLVADLFGLRLFGSGLSCVVKRISLEERLHELRMKRKAFEKELSA